MQHPAPLPHPGPRLSSTQKNARGSLFPTCSRGKGGGAGLLQWCPSFLRCILLEPSCWLVTLEMPVQIFKGLKTLTITPSTGPPCWVRWGLFLTYRLMIKCARQSVRGQRALRAFLNKSGQPQRVLGERGFVCISALEMHCLMTMSKA